MEQRKTKDANLRGGFLLKLSTASAQASDAVKLCLVVLQAEVLGFCAVHTAAHADVAAGWCASLANAALSVESDASWGRASRAVAGATISLCTEFRGQLADHVPCAWVLCVCCVVSKDTVIRIQSRGATISSVLAVVFGLGLPATTTTIVVFFVLSGLMILTTYPMLEYLHVFY